MTTETELRAAGFNNPDAFNGLSAWESDGPESASRVVLVFDGSAARLASMGPHATWRDLLQAESEARMLRAIAGGMTEGPGKTAMLAHADAVAPLGEIWTA